ncbi:MAG TPA: hypothetical protein VK196_06270 [Magnetospirillum sp.]|nr:hypothetical protein [Magnetospirillum sp.]
MPLRPVAAALMLLLVAACATGDRPASPERLGRFIGLVGRCGCSDVTADRLLADYPRALGDRYSAADIQRMRGFVDLGAGENFSNQVTICAEICSQTCAVNAVTVPLGGRPSGNGATCALTEGRLNLTTGWDDTE